MNSKTQPSIAPFKYNVKKRGRFYWSFIKKNPGKGDLSDGSLLDFSS